MSNFANGSDLDFEILQRIDEKSMKYLKRSTIGLPSIAPGSTTSRMGDTKLKSRNYLNY
jgi:hypothetical protein